MINDTVVEAKKESVTLIESEKKLVEDIVKLRAAPGSEGEVQYDLWKYFSDRADQQKERLWSTGTWLVAGMGALLAVMLQSDILEFRGWLPPLRSTVEARPAAVVLSVVGLFLAIFSVIIVYQYVDHVRRNWLRAIYLRSACQEPPTKVGDVAGARILYAVMVVFAVVYAAVLLHVTISILWPNHAV